MIVCRFLSGKPCELPVIEQETVREYCQRLMDIMHVGSYKETCHYLLLQNGKIVNQVDSRHKKLSEHIDMSKPIHALYASLQPPSQQALVRGNMRADGFEPDIKTCAICMRDFGGNTYSFRGTFTALDCGHRFHMSCLSEDPSGLCPICRTLIPGDRRWIIRTYGPQC